MSRKTLTKNAEVTLNGIKARGDPGKSGTKLVTVNSTPQGKFKKNLVYLSLTVMAAGNAIGMALDWSPDLVHVAYPMAGVYITGMLTTFLTKME